MAILNFCCSPFVSSSLLLEMLLRFNCKRALNFAEKRELYDEWSERFLSSLTEGETVLITAKPAPPSEEWEQSVHKLIKENFKEDEALLLSKNSGWVLDFWQNVFPKQKFVLFFCSPQYAFHQLIDSGIQCDWDILVKSWLVYNAEILQFYRKHQDCCYLLNAEQCLINPKEFFLFCKESLLLPVEDGRDLNINDLHEPLSFLDEMCLNNLINQNPEMEVLYQELIATSLPIGKPVIPRFREDDTVKLFNAWFDFHRLKFDLREQESSFEVLKKDFNFQRVENIRLEDTVKDLSTLIDKKNQDLENEKELLSNQIYQIQNELEKKYVSIQRLEEEKVNLKNTLSEKSFQHQNHLKDVNNKIDALTSQKRQIEESYETKKVKFQAEVRRKQNECEQLVKKFRDSEESYSLNIKALEQSINLNKEETQRLQGDKKSLDNTIEQLSERCCKQQKKIDEIQGKLQVSKEEHKKIKQIFEKQIDDLNGRIKQQGSDNEQKLKNAERIKSELEHKSQKLQKEKERLIQKALNEQQVAESKLNQAQKELKEINASLRQNKELFEKEKNESQKQLILLKQKQHQELQNVRQVFSEKLQGFTKEKETLEIMLQAEKVKFQEEARRKENEYEKLTNKIGKSEESYRLKIEELEQSIDLNNKKIERLHSNKKSLDSKVADLSESNSKQQEKINETVKNLKFAKDENEKNKQQYQQELKKVNEVFSKKFESFMEEKKALEITLKAEKVKLQEDLSVKQAAMERLLNDKKVQDRKLAEFSENSRKQQNKFDEILEELKLSEEEKELQIEKALTAQDDLKSQLHDAQTALKEKSESLLRKEELLEKIKAESQKDLMNLKASNKELQENLEALKNDTQQQLILNQQNHHLELQKVNQVFSNKLESFTEEKQALEATLQEQINIREIELRDFQKSQEEDREKYEKVKKALMDENSQISSDYQQELKKVNEVFSKKFESFMEEKKALEITLQAEKVKLQEDLSVKQEAMERLLNDKKLQDSKLAEFSENSRKQQNKFDEILEKLKFSEEENVKNKCVFDEEKELLIEKALKAQDDLKSQLHDAQTALKEKGGSLLRKEELLEKIKAESQKDLMNLKASNKELQENLEALKNDTQQQLILNKQNHHLELQKVNQVFSDKLGSCKEEKQALEVTLQEQINIREIELRDFQKSREEDREKYEKFKKALMDENLQISSDCQQEINALKNSLSIQKQQYEKLGRAMEKRGEEKQAFQEELKRQKTFTLEQETAFQKERKEIQNKVTSQKQDFVSLEAKYQETVNSLQCVNDKFKQYTKVSVNEIDRLNETLLIARDSYQIDKKKWKYELAQKKSELDQKINGLIAEHLEVVKKFNANKKELEDENGLLRLELESLNNRIITIQKKYSELEHYHVTESKNKDKVVVSLKKDVERYSQAYPLMVDQIHHLQDELVHKTDYVAEKNNEFKEISFKLNKLENELPFVVNHLKDVQHVLLKKADCLRKENNQNKITYENNKFQFEKQIKAAENKSKLMANKMTVLLSQIAQTQEELQKSHYEKLEFKEIITTSKKNEKRTKTVFEDTIKKLRQEHASVLKTFKSERDVVIKQVKNDYKVLTADTNHLKIKNKELSERLKINCSEREKLKVKITTSKADLQKQKSDKELIFGQLQQVQEELKYYFNKFNKKRLEKNNLIAYLTQKESSLLSVKIIHVKERYGCLEIGLINLKWRDNCWPNYQLKVISNKDHLEGADNTSGIRLSLQEGGLLPLQTWPSQTADQNGSFWFIDSFFLKKLPQNTCFAVEDIHFLKEMVSHLPGWLDELKQSLDIEQSKWQQYYDVMQKMQEDFVHITLS